MIDMTDKKFIRDKELKFRRITNSIKTLIEEKGYNRVSIQDIADKADVSVGLIYRYFPKGKFDILMQVDYELVDDYFLVDQLNKIDFEDFPSYMRMIIKNMIEKQRENDEFIKAITLATLMESNNNSHDIHEGFKKLDIGNFVIIPEFFSKFSNLELSDKDTSKIFNDWYLAIKGTMFLSTMYPTLFKDDESLLEMLVDLSLKMWYYNNHK